MTTKPDTNTDHDPHAVDPVIELARKRWRLDAELNAHPVARMKPGAAGYDDAYASQSELCHAVVEVEDEMLSLVATTREGIIEQLDVLRDLLSSEYAQYALNVIAGLRGLRP